MTADQNLQTVMFLKEAYFMAYLCHWGLSKFCQALCEQPMIQPQHLWSMVDLRNHRQIDDAVIRLVSSCKINSMSSHAMEIFTSFGRSKPQS